MDVYNVRDNTVKCERYNYDYGNYHFSTLFKTATYSILSKSTELVTTATFDKSKLSVDIFFTCPSNRPLGKVSPIPVVTTSAPFGISMFSLIPSTV